MFKPGYSGFLARTAGWRTLKILSEATLIYIIQIRNRSPIKNDCRLSKRRANHMKISRDVVCFSVVSFQPESSVV
jgi:hypothetical protein